MSRSPHQPARVLKVYTDTLPGSGARTVHCPPAAAVLANGSGRGDGRLSRVSEGRGEGPSNWGSRTRVNPRSRPLDDLLRQADGYKSPAESGQLQTQKRAGVSVSPMLRPQVEAVRQDCSPGAGVQEHLAPGVPKRAKFSHSPLTKSKGGMVKEKVIFSP